MINNITSWISNKKAQQAKRRIHLKAIRKYQPSAFFSPLYYHNSALASFSLVSLLWGLVLVSIMAMIGGALVSYGIDGLTLFLASWFLKITATTGASFRDVYGSFAIAVVALSCFTVQASMLFIQFGYTNPTIEAIYDSMVELDDRFQTSLAEMRLAGSEKQEEQ